MRTILKYPLRITDTQPIEMPTGAKILSVQTQCETVCLWAEVDTSDEAETSQRIIRIIGTGHKMPYGEILAHIGTVQQYDGTLVWHVFERTGFAPCN